MTELFYAVTTELFCFLYILGICDCGFEGFRGDYCERKECPGHGISCSGHGECNPSTETCLCLPGWTGTGCHIAKCEKDCSTHGTCMPLDEPACNCSSGYFGVGCEYRCVHGTITTPDPDDLSTQYCECDACYIGVECNTECSGRGTCVDGKCDCGKEGWRGDRCERAGCPGTNGIDCSGHGQCSYGSSSVIGNTGSSVQIFYIS